MGREIKRVPLDFNWPRHKVWSGFLNPHYDGHYSDCSACKGSGYSPIGKHMNDQWYGNANFSPFNTGSQPFPASHSIIQELALRNVFYSLLGRSAPYADRYVTTFEMKNEPKFRPDDLRNEIDSEAYRLARHFNAGWIHHLSQDDVDALWDSGRLERHFKEKPTAKQVNEWSLVGMSHDCINAHIIIKAKAKREGIELTCSECEGHGSKWDSPESKQRAEDWEKEEPPSGPGYQVWETVSEGSPVSPVFAQPEDLAKWMVENDSSVTGDATYEQWLDFIKRDGWAPSGMIVNGVQSSGVAATVPSPSTVSAEEVDPSVPVHSLKKLFQ